MQHMHREKRRVQSYAVLEVQTRLLLDVHGRLENSRKVCVVTLSFDHPPILSIIHPLIDSFIHPFIHGYFLSIIYSHDSFRSLSEYYECSRYKENPNIANESAHAKAREALKKYLFYFERWENHAKVTKTTTLMLTTIAGGTTMMKGKRDK